MDKINIDVLRKCSVAVYLACEEPVARDISNNLKWAIDELESKNKALKVAEDALVMIDDTISANTEASNLLVFMGLDKEDIKLDKFVDNTLSEIRAVKEGCDGR